MIDIKSIDVRYLNYCDVLQCSNSDNRMVISELIMHAAIILHLIQIDVFNSVDVCVDNDTVQRLQ